MSTLSFPASSVYLRNYAAESRYVANQGGTSSGKTWSILQVLITLALKMNYRISICSQSLPHLKKGAMRDYIQILESMQLYNEKFHNKTDNIFRLANSHIEFFSLDDPGKARGPRRDILFVNEANLIPWDTFYQLAIRTNRKIFFDYNPDSEEHWIYEKVLSRTDCEMIQSTYKDNPFLDPAIRMEIERLRDIDPDYWQVYGLGNRGHSRNLVYPQWAFCETMPEDGDVFYGLDFGYNVPTALVKCVLKDGVQLYVSEVIYQTYLTNAELIELMKKLLPPRALIYADAAEPQRIREIQLAGFNCKPADKSVRDGIDKLKRLQVSVTKNSVNLIKERNAYKWITDANGKNTDSPLKFMDHALDAIRYAVHTHGMRPTGRYLII